NFFFRRASGARRRSRVALRRLSMSFCCSAVKTIGFMGICARCWVMLQVGVSEMLAYCTRRFSTGDGIQRLPEAVDELHRALQLKPKQARAHHDLGNCLLSLGGAAQAADGDRRAVRANTDTAAAHNNRGTALIGLDKPAEAVEEFRRAAHLQPKDALARARQSFLLAGVGGTGTTAPGPAAPTGRL